MRVPSVCRTLAVFAWFHATALFAQVIPLGPEHGISLHQLNYPGLQNGAHTATGAIDIDLLRLRQSTGLESGYFNLATATGWVVRNIPIPSEAAYPYARLSRHFRLEVNAGTALTTLQASANLSRDPLDSYTATPSTAYPVAAREIVIGGVGDTPNTSAPPVPAAPLPGTEPTAVLPADKLIVQLDHPNLEAALNQCMPMSVANSLQYLKNRTGLPVPHEHKAGLRGDDSLVGQLDTAMDRPATSRQSGSGTWGLVGKLKYLARNGLAERVETSHWGTGDAAEPSNTQVSVTEGGVTARSTGRGALNFPQILAALEQGDDCEMVYAWPGGAHAVDLVAAGIDRGKQWLTHASDVNQASDTEGAGPAGFVQEELGTDWKLNPTGAQVVQVICQKALPAKAGVTVIETMDPAGHSCCVEPPPAHWWFDANATTVTATNAQGSTAWLPLTGTVDANGSFTLNGTGTVAGFTGVKSQMTGTLGANPFTATITVGTQGELYGQPIAWRVQVSDALTAPRPAIRINGMRQSYEAGTQELRRISLGMHAASMVGQRGDWWVVAASAQGLFSLDLGTASWKTGLQPTYSGALQSFDYLPLPYELTNGLPPGSYQFYFGFDSVPNGNLDAAALVVDRVDLSVR